MLHRGVDREHGVEAVLCLDFLLSVHHELSALATHFHLAPAAHAIELRIQLPLEPVEAGRLGADDPARGIRARDRPYETEHVRGEGLVGVDANLVVHGVGVDGLGPQFAVEGLLLTREFLLVHASESELRHRGGDLPPLLQRHFVRQHDVAIGDDDELVRDDDVAVREDERGVGGDEVVVRGHDAFVEGDETVRVQRTAWREHVAIHEHDVAVGEQSAIERRDRVGADRDLRQEALVQLGLGDLENRRERSGDV